MSGETNVAAATYSGSKVVPGNNDDNYLDKVGVTFVTFILNA